MSRLNLDLNATHPDKAAWLGFLAGSLRRSRRAYWPTESSSPVRG